MTDGRGGFRDRRREGGREGGREVVGGEGRGRVQGKGKEEWLDGGSR